MRSDVTEKDFQTAVIEVAHLGGWRVAHFRPARTKHGWATPVAADGKGFPDLVLVHPTGGVLFAELKSEKGMLSADQKAWVNDLEDSGTDVRVWRPSHFDTDIVPTLLHPESGTR